MKPFIYIASLRRTGSTVLSEALTLLPYSFIFLEPKFGEEKFSIKKRDAEMFLKHGIDLEAFKNNWSGNKQKYIIEAFKRELMPHLASYVSQVGVKEIHHDGWRKYIQYFPEMKILLTGRDPRDIYISLFYRVKSGKGNFPGIYSTETVAYDLNKEFQKQLEMYREIECLKIRYEDFCTDNKIFEKILTFVESKIPNIGAIGGFNASHPKRRDEYELHGSYITDKRVSRWQYESLLDMLETCGFRDIGIAYQRDVDNRIERLCVHALPKDHVPFEKIFPRKKELMSLYGGERKARSGK